MPKKFIYTSSKESADTLKKLGFIVINESSNGWTFIYDKKIIFQKIDNVIFTNKLSV